MCKHIYNPDQTYPKGTPFTYLLIWKDGTYYYGVRYKKNCHPDDLWNIYFTSSTYVSKFIELNGDPEYIQIWIFDDANEAREDEIKFIKDNNCVRDLNCLNKKCPGEKFCNLQTSEETKLKLSELNTGKFFINNGIINKFVSKETFSLLNPEEWNIGFTDEIKQKFYELNTNRVVTEEVRKKLSDAKKGKPANNKGIPRTQEQKDYHSMIMKTKVRTAEHSKNQSEAQKGTIWINNGIEQKRLKKEDAKVFLENDFVLGRLPNTSEYFAIKGKIWINNGEINKLILSENSEEYFNLGWNHGVLPRTEEHLKKISEASKNTIVINNGEIQKRVSLEEAEILFTQGFSKGLLQKNINANSKSKIGKTWINNGEINKYVLLEEVEQYLQNGWLLKKIKTGKFWINNGKENLLVFLEEAITLYPLGFSKGRFR